VIENPQYVFQGFYLSLQSKQIVSQFLQSQQSHFIYLTNMQRNVLKNKEP